MKLANLWRKKKKKSPYGFFGGYSTWAQALKDSTSYTAAVIIEGTLRRREMSLGAFDANDRFVEGGNQHMLLLSALAYILTSPPQTTLKVLDYGGSFGHYFYLLRRSLPHVEIDWTVIETEEMSAAHRTFEEPHIRWQSALPTINVGTPKPYDLCLASSSLPYVPEPYEGLAKLAKLGRFILITRTGFIKETEDRVAVQRVPPEIFDGSYPAWIFSQEKFLARMLTLGRLCLDWNAPQDSFEFEGRKIMYKGYLYECF